MIVLMMSAMLWLGGCNATGDRVRHDPTEPLPSYQSLIESYNQRVERLDRVWSRAVVSVRWVDDRGRRQFEQGEGHFIFIRPHHVALNVGKLGRTLLWAGCDESQYWLFDLSQDPKLAYVGRMDQLDQAAASAFPMPVFPFEVLYLLGAMPLDAQAVPQEPAVEWLQGHYLIEPPGTGLRMLLDRQTHRPRRIDLLDERGASVIICQLDRYAAVEQQGVGPGGWPWMATRIEITIPGQEGSLRMSLSDQTDGRAFDTINPRIFELPRLMRMHNPDQVIDLDDVR